MRFALLIWDHWGEWVTERSGNLVPAPKELGGGRFPAQAEAPGSYVRQPN